MLPYKKKVAHYEMPEDFTRETVETVVRIDDKHNVVGVLYLKNQHMMMCTVPENMSQGLIASLPVLTGHVRYALSEINVLDELVAYRIETKTVEVLVAPTDDGIACAVLKLERKRKTKRKQMILH